MKTPPFTFSRDMEPGDAPPARYTITITPSVEDPTFPPVTVEATAFHLSALTAPLALVEESQLGPGVEWQFTQSGTGLERMLLLARAIASLSEEFPPAVSRAIVVAMEMRKVDS